MGFLPIAFPESLRSPSPRNVPKLPRPPRKRLQRISLFGLPVLAAGLLAGCISDGPNQTGSDYLSDHQIILNSPLYHVKIAHFPVDRYWTTDAEPSHLNDTILLAGVNGPFTAEPRFAFYITDTTHLDSLSDAPTSLRLSLSTPIFVNVGSFADNGTKALESLVDSSRDSLRFAVYSWDFNNGGVPDDIWNDSLAQRNRHFLIQGDSLALLPPPTVVDTISLKVASAYALRAQLQASPLRHLLDTLANHKGHLNLIQMRLIPLPGSNPADTLPAMLRLGGQWAYDASHMPALLFGRNWASDSLDGHNRVTPLDAGGGQLGVSYTLRYSGPRANMVVPLQRGVHVTFDRARLEDSIDSALVRQHLPLPPRPTGAFSLQYYVPFAAITLPINTPKLEAGLPVQVRLITAVDSLLGDTLTAGTREDRILSGSSVTAWYTTEIGHPEVIVDNVSLSYAKVDTLRRIVLSFSKDSTRNDTVFLPVGGNGQINASLTGYGKSNVLHIDLQAGPDTLTAMSYLSLRSGLENNSFRDPVTGDPMPLDSLVPRFVNAGSDGIRLRATEGIRTLLNRTLMGTNARQDFEFRPYFRAFNPKAAPSSGDSLAHEVVFPVLSVIPPRIESGALSVDFDLYLYPLKAR